MKTTIERHTVEQLIRHYTIVHGVLEFSSLDVAKWLRDAGSREFTWNLRWSFSWYAVSQLETVLRSMENDVLSYRWASVNAMTTKLYRLK